MAGLEFVAVDNMCVELSDDARFLPVTDQQTDGSAAVYYGGDQAWFATRVGRLSGCGAVAAADVFAWLARRGGQLEKLYHGDPLHPAKAEFLRHMEDVIRFVRPTSIHSLDIPYGGLTSIKRFVRFSEAFAASRGVKLAGHVVENNKMELNEAAQVVLGWLRADYPVAMLNMRNRALAAVPHADAAGNPTQSDLQFHWVVLTALRRSEGRWIATASSEGCRVEFDFESAWTCDSRAVFGWRGLVCFQP